MVFATASGIKAHGVRALARARDHEPETHAGHARRDDIHGGRFPAIDAVTINGIVAPAGTPKDYVQRVNAVVIRALKWPEMQAKLVDLGFEAAGGSPEEFAA